MSCSVSQLKIYSTSIKLDKNKVILDSKTAMDIKPLKKKKKLVLVEEMDCC